MAAWRDLVGIEAPDELAGEEEYLADLSIERAHTSDVGALTGPTLTGVHWYLGVQTADPLELSARTEEAFGFGLRDVDAFATIEGRSAPNQS